MNVVRPREGGDHRPPASFDEPAGDSPAGPLRESRSGVRLSLAQSVGFWILVASVAVMAGVSLTEFFLLVQP